MGIIQDRGRMIGWAWGSTDDGEWLTIAGSALYTAELTEAPEDARPPAPILGCTQVLARVERRGTVTGWCACSIWRYDLSNRASVWVSGWRSTAEREAASVRQDYRDEHAAVIGTGR